MGIPTITRWLVSDDVERERVAPLLAEHEGETELVDATTRVFYDADGEPAGTIEEVLGPVFEALPLQIGNNEGTHEFGRTFAIDLAGVRTAVRGFDYRVEVSQGMHEFTVGDASSVAELIFQTVEGTVRESVDRVIYDTDLRDLGLDANGVVVPRRDDAKRE